MEVGDTVRIRLEYCDDTPFKSGVIKHIYQGMAIMKLVDSNIMLTVSLKILEFEHEL